MSRLFVASVVAAALCAGAQAQETKGPIPIEVPKRDKPVDFRADVLPFLKTNCIACHHAKDPEGQLVLESPKTILKGGDTGPAVIPGKGAESLLLQSASHQKKPLMPPRKNKVGAGTLTPQQLGLLKLWIDQGAKESLTPEVEAPHWQHVANAWHPIYAVGLDGEGQFAACGRAGHLFLYHVPTGRLIDQPADPKLAALVAPGEPRSASGRKSSPRARARSSCPPMRSSSPWIATARASPSPRPATSSASSTSRPGKPPPTSRGMPTR